MSRYSVSEYTGALQALMPMGGTAGVGECLPTQR